MAYSGRFTPKSPNKYKGDPTNIIWRSTWELRFLKYLDTNPAILEYGSEEIVVPYISPLDGKAHRYYVDFHFIVRTKEGINKKYLVELEEFLLKEKCIKFNLSYNDNIIETITMDIKKYKTKVPDNFYDLSLIGGETEYNHPHYGSYGIEQADSKTINGLEVIRGGLTYIFTYY